VLQLIFIWSKEMTGICLGILYTRGGQSAARGPNPAHHDEMITNDYLEILSECDIQN
jgi:hypothetical protein